MVPLLSPYMAEAAPLITTFRTEGVAPPGEAPSPPESRAPAKGRTNADEPSHPTPAEITTPTAPPTTPTEARDTTPIKVAAGTHLKLTTKNPGEVRAGVDVPAATKAPTWVKAPTNKTKVPATPTKAEALTIPTEVKLPTTPAEVRSPSTISYASTTTEVPPGEAPNAHGAHPPTLKPHRVGHEHVSRGSTCRLQATEGEAPLREAPAASLDEIQVSTPAGPRVLTLDEAATRRLLRPPAEPPG